MQKKKVKLIINPLQQRSFPISSKVKQMASTLCMFYSFYTSVCSQGKRNCQCALFCFSLSLTAAIWNPPWYIAFSRRDACCQESTPHIYQHRSWCKKNRDTYNWFIFSVWAHSRPNKSVKEKFLFFWGGYRGCIISQAWILNFSLMSTRPWVPAPHLHPAVINAASSRAAAWCGPLHRWGGTAKATGKKSESEEEWEWTDRWKQAVERDSKWTDMSRRRADGWATGERQWETHRRWVMTRGGGNKGNSITSPSPQSRPNVIKVSAGVTRKRDADDSPVWKRRK